VASHEGAPHITFGVGFCTMSTDEKQDPLETAKAEVADTISTLANAEHHPVLIYAAMMSVILEIIMTEGFWEDGPPSFEDIRGFGNLMWKLRQTAFADIAYDR
jgi:hypothetical protein